MVDVTNEYYLGDPWELDPELVASNWVQITSTLVSLDIPEGSLRRLIDLVREEHQGAPHALPVLPLVYRTASVTSIVRRQSETKARRTGYQIEASIVEPTGDAAHGLTDQIFFVNGEPAERSVTKVGGLPYRAAGVPWPLTDAGQPMTFLAQFCFAESRDLFGKLPGEILLIFAEGREAYLPNPYDSSLRFERYPLGLGNLIRAQEIPVVDWILRPYFGIIHRTNDEHLVGHPQGETKIGGEPAWIQGNESPGGRFFCELGRLRRVPAQWDRWGRDEETGDRTGDELSMHDAGCLYFFLREDGAIRWAFQTF
jgi:hypothetical protein